LPNVNKKSLREEFDALKQEFESLAKKGKISSEARLLFKSMFTMFELVLAVFLEKQTKKTSRNSSIPSSQTDKDQSQKTSQTSRGKKELDKKFDNSRTVKSIEIAEVGVCQDCGEDLSDIKPDGHERRTKIDIIFEKTEEHIDAEVKTCPNCSSENKGEFPPEFFGPLQYGIGIKAYVISLVVSQMVALGRVKNMVKTLIGVTMSEATILSYILKLYEMLESWEKMAIEELIKTKASNLDETSLRVNKKNYWIHVYSSGTITLKFLHKKRGTEAIEDIGIIPRYGGVIIHDCWSPYFCYDNCLHAICGSHLLRDLQFIIDSNGYSFAGNMKKLLQETCRVVSDRKSKKLKSCEYANLQKRYRNILTRGEKELPEIPEKKSGKRGRIAKPDAHNLHERLRNHEEAVLLFAKNPHVSFTNNRAERDLRMDKVKQKVSGCFRSELLANVYCRVSSYLQTMKYLGYNPLVAIQMALKGDIPKISS